MKIRNNRVISKKNDVVAIASLSIATTTKLIYLFLTILTIIVGLFGFYGYSSLKDIEASGQQSIHIRDSLRTILSEVKVIQENVKNFSILSENNYIKTNNIYDSLSYRYQKSKIIEKVILDNKNQLERIQNKVNEQNYQIVSIANIFNEVGAANQSLLDGRERLILYLLARETDKIKIPELQDPNIIMNLGSIWYRLGQYTKALENFELIKNKVPLMNDWAKKNFDPMYNDCLSKKDLKK
ncbi:MAG: hypothetical protein WC055_16205 [Melioribacteraceae bacterium]